MQTNLKLKRRHFVLGFVPSILGLLATRQNKAKAQNEAMLVKTAEELFKAMGSNRTIHLEPGTYILSDLDPALESNNVYFEEDIDGTVVIFGLENLTLVGIGTPPPRLLTAPHRADVLRLQNCRKITLKNIEMGHVPETNVPCSGAVLSLMRSQDILIENCILFGSGYYGIFVNYTENVVCKNTEIKECTSNIVYIFSGSNFWFENCEFRNNINNRGLALVDIANSQNIAFNNCEFTENKTRDYLFDITAFESLTSNSQVPYPIVLQNCVIENNRFLNLSSDIKSIEWIDSIVRNNSFDGEI